MEGRLHLREKLLHSSIGTIKLETVALLLECKRCIKTVQAMLILGESLFESSRLVKHYSCIIGETSLLLMLNVCLSSERVVSCVDASPPTRVMILPEALRNVLACNRANR